MGVSVCRETGAQTRVSVPHRPWIFEQISLHVSKTLSNVAQTTAVQIRLKLAGEAGARTLAPGFSRGKQGDLGFGARFSGRQIADRRRFCRPLKRAPKFEALENPRLKPGAT